MNKFTLQICIQKKLWKLLRSSYYLLLQFTKFLSVGSIITQTISMKDHNTFRNYAPMDLAPCLRIKIS